MGYRVKITDEFIGWLAGLDYMAQAIITGRLKRIKKTGNLGDWKRLAGQDGLCELRFKSGPGYRVYFGFLGADIIVTTGGGDKNTPNGQRRDIEAAHDVWLDEKEAFDEGKQTRA